VTARRPEHRIETTLKEPAPLWLPERPTNTLPATASDRQIPTRPVKLENDTLDLSLKCAVTDDCSVLRFRRGEAAGKFLVGSIYSGTALERIRSTPSIGLRYADKEIVFEHVECPHCGAGGGTLYCFTCKSLICRGHVEEQERGIAVRCSPSCGATGFLVVYRTQTETAYRERICVGHIEAVTRTTRYAAPGTGNFFNCCDLCDGQGGSTRF
jgi:hypothetical protein